MLSVTFSFSNLAEWTPITTSSLGYFSSSLARSGRTWMQLMQQNVQKSSRTILPLRSRRRMGPAVFSHATPPSSGSQLTTRWVTRLTTSAASSAASVADTAFSTFASSFSFGASFLASSFPPLGGAGGFTPRRRQALDPSPRALYGEGVGRRPIRSRAIHRPPGLITHGNRRRDLGPQVGTGDNASPARPRARARARKRSQRHPVR